MEVPKSNEVTIKCICCRKEVERADYQDPRPVINDNYHHGMVGVIDAGYGSKHDTSCFIIGICDDCAYQCIKDGRLIEFWNHFEGQKI